VIRVLLAEDQAMVRGALAGLLSLEPDIEVVSQVARGDEVLAAALEARPDVALLDIEMPGIDGYEVCRRIRANPRTAFLPVVMITASGDQQRIVALEAGADDFVAKPFNSAELLARVRSLVRIKRFHDTVERQAAELEAWNRELERRVGEQVTELERMGRLRRFLSPQVAELVRSGDESALLSHRREVVVLFCDLRGFTAFAESSEPEEVMGVLGSYHEALGRLIHHHEGTLERFTGDGLMVFFNDPVPCDDPVERAVRLGLDMRERVRELETGWSRYGHDLGFSVGLARGYATLGRVGYAGRFDYAAIGTVTNLAARLCAEAGPWQVLTHERVVAGLGDTVDAGLVGTLELKGLSRPVRAFEVRALAGSGVAT
jgi:adenylate cyclase